MIILKLKKYIKKWYGNIILLNNSKLICINVLNMSKIPIKLDSKDGARYV